MLTSHILQPVRMSSMSARRRAIPFYYARKANVHDSSTVNANGREDVAERNDEDTTDADAFPVDADDNPLPTQQSIVEPLQPRPTPARPQSSFGMFEASFDLSGGLGVGLRDSMGSIQLGEMRSAFDQLVDNVKGSSGPSTKKPN